MLGRPAVLLTPPRSNSQLLLPRSFSGVPTDSYTFALPVDTVSVQTPGPSPFPSTTSALVHKNTRLSPRACPATSHSSLVYPEHRRATIFFRCNTYGNEVRNPFRCNTYKKQGEGA